MPGANMLRETADSIQCGVCNYHHAKGETRSMNADEIVRKLANTKPWDFDFKADTFRCRFCDTVRKFGTAAWHADSCIWTAAMKCYAAPVASQEPAPSPIESRVDELLSETETCQSCGLRISQRGRCIDCLARPSR